MICCLRSEFDVLFWGRLKRPFCHINQCAGPLHSTYSIIPNVLALLPPADDLLEEGGMAIFVVQPFLLSTSWRQLIICPLNLIHFLCAKSFQGALSLVQGESRPCSPRPPSELADHCGKSARQSICPCYPSNQSFVAKVKVSPYEPVTQLVSLAWYIFFLSYLSLYMCLFFACLVALLLWPVKGILYLFTAIPY